MSEKIHVLKETASGFTQLMAQKEVSLTGDSTGDD